jgi:hypothetical protein
MKNLVRFSRFTLAVVLVVALAKVATPTPSKIKHVNEVLTGKDAWAELTKEFSKSPKYKVDYENEMAKLRGSGADVSDDDILYVRDYYVEERDSTLAAIGRFFNVPVSAQTVTGSGGDVVLRGFNMTGSSSSTEWNSYTRNYATNVKFSMNVAYYYQKAWTDSSSHYQWGSSLIADNNAVPRFNPLKGLRDWLEPPVAAQFCPSYYMDGINCNNQSAIANNISNKTWADGTQNCLYGASACGFGALFAGAAFFPCSGAACVGSYGAAAIWNFSRYVNNCIVAMGICQGARTTCCVKLW